MLLGYYEVVKPVWLGELANLVCLDRSHYLEDLRVHQTSSR